MVDKVMFSSESTEYGTPQDLFDELNREFYFNLDPAATFKNKKCSHFYTEEQDGLKQPWDISVWQDTVPIEAGKKRTPGRVFCNPPYGRKEKACDEKTCTKKRCQKRGYHLKEDVPGTSAWVEKAYREVFELKRAEVAVLLLPARTCQPWFHNYIYNKNRPRANTEIRFLKGRVKFEGADYGAAFPSMIVIFKKHQRLTLRP